MENLIITAAICGAEVTKNQNPNVPYTVDEIINEANLAYKAGASIIHLHVRENDGTPTQDYHIFKKCIDGIKECCKDVIIQPSTGGAVGMSNDERLIPLKLKPEIATLDCGTLNFGKDEIFLNTENTIIYFAEKMQQLNIKPEIEVFDKGMIDTALRLLKNGTLKSPLKFNFVLGVPGGINASLRDLAFLVGSIPFDSVYTVTGIGRHQFNMATLAIASGGHVRVGFEDNLYIEQGILARSNADMVKKVVHIANILGRNIATPNEARKILNIKEEN